MPTDEEARKTVTDLVAEIELVREELLAIQVRLQKIAPEEPVGKYDGEKGTSGPA